MVTAEVEIRHDLKAPMRDGVLLSADLYRPAGTGRLPALLCRTIYDKQRPANVAMAHRFAAHGYAVLLQDCRGRYDSEGVWDPYRCEAEDGYDTQEWLGRQPWCDGAIGTFGSSYLGFTQILPAPYRSPFVKALVPTANQEDNFGHLYVDGVLQLQNAVNFCRIGRRTMREASWSLVDREALYRRLPLISALDDVAPDLPAYRSFLEHPTFDDFWSSYSLKGRYPEVDTPALFITGWYDNLVHEMFKCFRGWTTQARSAETRRLTKLLVGPWSHQAIGAGVVGDVDFGAVAAVDIPALHLCWYDRRLKGIETGIDDDPPMRLFVMGANVWRDEREWPLARTRWTAYYLRSRGGANTRFGDGKLAPTAPEDEPPDTFLYDPLDPAPTHGGPSMFAETTGPRDRRSIEVREDVLVYTTPPLDEDVEVTGAPRLVFHAATDAVDTDFTAALVDVHPGGAAIVICDGIVRARFRDSLDRPTLIEAGRVYEYAIVLWETSNVFKAGHRIRLEISSSNFPRFNRNLNGGGNLATETETRPARQTIRHDRRCPSRLILPIIPRGSHPAIPAELSG